MDKRYQVFLSSTFTDLKEERQCVIHTLMEMDCIPAGMELFPAADDEQWEFIKKIIKDCDYYILILGGRYGSTTPEGISYTEKEYEYAMERGLKILAFIHENPSRISVAKSERDPLLQAKLDNFRTRASSGRLVKFWSETKDLPGLVALSLTKTIKTYPAVGWVRADKVANSELLEELNALRKRNQELEREVSNKSIFSDTEEAEFKYIWEKIDTPLPISVLVEDEEVKKYLSCRYIMSILTEICRHKYDNFIITSHLEQMIKEVSEVKPKSYYVWFC